MQQLPRPFLQSRSLTTTAPNSADADRRSMGYNSFNDSNSLASLLDSNASGNASLLPTSLTEIEPTHRLHVYATKHNTHLTFVQPPKKDRTDPSKVQDVLLSLSAGNLGFRKAGRGSYDAAYQLTAFLLKQIQERGLLRDVQKLEVVLRGFGAGREAVTKALLGQEGRNIRNRISAVVDATRLKFGGARSPKPRRLG